MDLSHQIITENGQVDTQIGAFVNDKIRMYKKWKIKMYNFVHPYFQDFVHFYIDINSVTISELHIYFPDRVDIN